MNSIITWFKSKNITSHTVLAGAIALAVLITTDQQAQSFIVSILQAHPVAASDIILLAGVVAKYSHSTIQEKLPVDGTATLGLNK
jgi:hypothetical protein